MASNPAIATGLLFSPFIDMGRRRADDKGVGNLAYRQLALTDVADPVEGGAALSVNQSEKPAWEGKLSRSPFKRDAT